MFLPCLKIFYYVQIFICRQLANYRTFCIAETLSMVAIIALVLTILVVFVVTIILLTVAYNRRRLCFKGMLLKFTFTTDRISNDILCCNLTEGVNLIYPING